MPQTQKVGTVPLYRIENPNIVAEPNGVTSYEDLVGQWFSPNIDTALRYLRKATQTFGKNAGPVDGAQLVVAHVPTERLDQLHVSEHPVAKDMDVEGDNYVVPLDGTVAMDTLPLDETIGDLRGRLGNVAIQRVARERVHELLGRVAVEK